MICKVMKLCREFNFSDLRLGCLVYNYLRPVPVQCPVAVKLVLLLVLVYTSIQFIHPYPKVVGEAFATCTSLMFSGELLSQSF